MKRIAVAVLVHIALFSAVVSVGGATRPKFRPATTSGASDSRYVVTLTEDAGVDDLAALRQQLAQIYGAKLEVNASSARQFAVTTSYARARLLSSDPRVIEVVEVPPTTPPPSRTPASSAHLKSRPTGYGDNGQSGTYSYDGAGNITAIGADTYVYDSSQRLVSSVTRGVQENYTYDAYGNRTSATGAVNCLGQTNCAQTVTVDSNTNHLTAINGATVTYDVAGNISTIAATSTTPGAVYTYDALGRMTRATVGSDDRQFLYNADDERIAVRQGVSWTWMMRDQSGKVLREFTSLESGSGPTLAMTNWKWAKDYIWRDGLLLATVTPSGTLHYHLDHLGTPRLVTDANGVKVAEHAYYPFGAEINLTPHENPEEAMKFTGHERDLVAGDGHSLDYMHARYYNANLGRFLSVDPIVAADAPLKPQHWNRYTYAFNSPLGYSDPTGRTVYNQLNADDSALLLQQLRDKTGLDLYYDDNNKLQSHGQMNDANGHALGSATARAGVLAAIAPGSTHILQSDSHVWIAQNTGAVTKMNFADIRQINTGRNAPATFDAASIMIHEMIGHGSKGLFDFPGQQTNNQSFIFSHPNWKGPVVDFDNKIRRELGLPERCQYSTQQDNQNQTFIPFQNGPVYLPAAHQ